jgi:hypothetical protein
MATSNIQMVQSTKRLIMAAAGMALRAFILTHFLPSEAQLVEYRFYCPQPTRMLWLIGNETERD